MKALLIEFDVRTGRRAGNISPRDPGLYCHGWQDLKGIPAKEIRLIEDERDLKQYEGIEGITILNNDDEIEKAIENVIPETIAIENEMLMRLDIEQRGIQIKDLRAKNTTELLQELKTLGVKGIGTRKPLKLKEVKKHKV